MKAFKVFDSNWKCRDFQYQVGQTYEIEEKPILCKRGFHACKKLSDCFTYYEFDPKNKVAEVELLGDIEGLDNDKQVTNKIRIVKELSWQEVLDLVNSGKGNSGYKNSGHRNSSDWNSGDWNSGDWNSGDFNSGDRNSGDRNSGDRNSGDRNSGNRNSGNRNSGDWNSGNWNSGAFNIDEPNARLFGKETDKKLSEIKFPSWLYFRLTEWISEKEASEEEKIKYAKEIEISGGFLKTYEYKEAFQKSYEKASEEERMKVKELPNFDSDIFFEISGIRIN